MSQEHKFQQLNQHPTSSDYYTLQQQYDYYTLQQQYNYAYYQQQQSLQQQYYYTQNQYNIYAPYQIPQPLQNPIQPLIKPPKPSRNQKRKQKLREKKQELDQEKKQIGDWVKLESKDLIHEIQLLQEQQAKRLEKRKTKLQHLVEIGAEVFKLRKKMGLLRAETNKAKLSKMLGVTHKKKPSLLKRMNERFSHLLKRTPLPTIVEDQGDWETLKDLKKEEIVEYPPPGKLTGSLFNSIELREWVDHMPSESLEGKILSFINRLSYQQAIKKIKQPLKWKKRIVAGFNECVRTVKTKQEDKRCRCLFVALNIIRNPLKHASDDRILEIIHLAKTINVPIIHVSTRSKLGRAFLGKFGPRLSVLSVINFEGTLQAFFEITEEWKSLQEEYLSK